MDQSSSTYTLLSSTVEQKHRKWLSCISVKKKPLRSQSSSPDGRKSTECLIDRSVTDHRLNSSKIVKIVPVPDDFPYFTLTIKPRSSLFLVYANEAAQQIILTSLAGGWGLDARKRRLSGYGDDGAYWIRLRNQPFLDGTGILPKVRITRTVLDCINRLRQIGWDLMTSIDLANQYPASTLFFRRIAQPDTRSINFLEPTPCLCVTGSDTISLIDSNENLIQTFKRTVMELYEPGLAKRSPTAKENRGGNQEKSSNWISLRLKGQPFFSHDRTECVRGRQLILDLVTEFDSNGYQPMGILNLTSSSDSILFSKKSRPDIKNRYFSISLILTNKIRLIDAPSDVLEEIRQLTMRGPWQPGLETLTVENQRVTKVKFKGHPWNPVAVEGNWARRFLCHLFVRLAKLGWRCCLSFDLNRHTYNKATFLFTRPIDQPIPEYRSTYHVFCLNLSSGSYCQLIDAPDMVRQKFSAVATSAWPKPVTEDKALGDGTQEWTLHLSPWSWGKLFDPHGRALISIFIDECSKLGYRVLTAANILTKYDMPQEPYPRDAHCIFFESMD